MHDKIDKGNKLKWDLAKHKGSTTVAISSGVNADIAKLMEHFAPKLLIHGWIKKSNSYNVVQWCIEQMMEALVKEEREGRL